MVLCEIEWDLARKEEPVTDEGFKSSQTKLIEALLDVGSRSSGCHGPAEWCVDLLPVVAVASAGYNVSVSTNYPGGFVGSSWTCSDGSSCHDARYRLCGQVDMTQDCR